MLKIPLKSKKKIQKTVEGAIDTYRMCLLTFPLEKQPKITASYSLVPPSNNNDFYSSTEEIAITRVDQYRERENYINEFQKALNKLAESERKGIILRYLGEEELYDYEVYNQLGMSETFYHQKFKPRMLLNFGLALGLLDPHELCGRIPV
ncbi:ArpU family transcriptional regulator (plasmid) [Sutcliffiella horikoshii]|uniref:ArpU family phage packaging/lysis transcriptional regulator n=1 Tax=Sutcliffiella horikoshii TaxID=79883 RepID=UPI001CBC0440|nr:ArpU family phage packaging/lysis transcriptional regulator [Sutcliffiella horikoshii]UAL49740.1 ArpU family transcriptional regulator [Sutcliffiella horikoshii]